MSTSTPSPNDDFAARLDRIRARQGQAVLMVGQDEQHVLPRKEIKQISRKREIAGNALYPASLLGAVLLGGVGVGLGQYAHFHMMESVAELQDPVNEMIFVAVIGVCLSFVLSQAFKLTTKEHRTLQGLGVFLMVGMFHNLSHWAPGPMSTLFSPQWVEETVASTPRATFRLGQRYLPILADTETEVPVDLVSTPAANTKTSAEALPPCPAGQIEAAQSKPEVVVINPKGESGSRKSIKITQAEATMAPAGTAAPQSATCSGG